MTSGSPRSGARGRRAEASRGEGRCWARPTYIAPEQISDARRADIRADIYSLGCTLYYLLTGAPPFEGASLYDILKAHHTLEPTPLNLARPEVPVELAALVARMMAKEAKRRFQEPKEVAQALTPFFKKWGVPAAGSKPEFSQAGLTDRKEEGAVAGPVPTQLAAELAPAPEPRGRTTARGSRSGTILEDSSGFEDTGASPGATPAVAKTRR